MPKKPGVLKTKAKKPSTWAALAGIAASLAPFVPPQYQVAMGAIGAVLGSVGALIPGFAP